MRFALAVSVRESFSRQHLRSRGLARARKKNHAALRGCGKLGDGSFLAVGRWQFPRRRALGGGSGGLWQALEGSSGVLWGALGSSALGCGKLGDGSFLAVGRWQFPRRRAMAVSSPSGSGGWLWEAVGSFGRDLWGNTPRGYGPATTARTAAPPTKILNILNFGRPRRSSECSEFSSVKRRFTRQSPDRPLWSRVHGGNSEHSELRWRREMFRMFRIYALASVLLASSAFFI